MLFFVCNFAFEIKRNGLCPMHKNIINKNKKIMEKLVLIQEVGAYSERQYNKQDGSQEY